jgi:hypothetical protein
MLLLRKTIKIPVKFPAAFRYVINVPYFVEKASSFICSLYAFFLTGIVGGGIQMGPLGTAATNRSIVPPPGDCDDREIGGMMGRGNRSTQSKPASVPLCPPQTLHAARTRTRAASVGSQRLTA